MENSTSQAVHQPSDGEELGRMVLLLRRTVNRNYSTQLI